MPTQALHQSQAKCIWTVKERHNGLWVPVFQKKNVITNYGLSALSAAPGGGYVPPQFLSLDSSTTTLLTTVVPGATQIITNAALDISGDDQLVLSVGQSTQEVVTFSAKSGTSGAYTYSLSSPVTQVHVAGDIVCRQPNQNDDITTIVSPIQYDSVNAPNLWPVASSGYSTGVGNWIIQFYLTGTQAIGYIATIGLTDSQTIGSGNLHTHLVFGYNHTSSVGDIEIDASITLTFKPS